MILFFLAGLAAGPTIAPRIVSPRSGIQADTEQSKNRRVQIGVIMRSGDRTILEGSLWVSPRNGANLQQTLNEALPDQCGNLRSYGADRSEASVRLAITSGDDGDSTRILSVNARWVRPAVGPCDGTRTVEVQQGVPLDGAGPFVIQGDGGLAVEVRRR